MTEPVPFPEPTAPAASRAEVFLRYLGHPDIVVEFATAQVGELFFGRTGRGARPRPGASQPVSSATHKFTHSPRPSMKVRSTLPGRR